MADGRPTPPERRSLDREAEAVMNKRPVAFRVPRLLGDMVSHYFVTTSEDEARAMADTNQVEYEGLYLVGDRHSGDVAQGASDPLTEACRVHVLETALREIRRYSDENLGPSRSSLLNKIAHTADVALDLVAQPPAAPVDISTATPNATTVAALQEAERQRCSAGNAGLVKELREQAIYVTKDTPSDEKIMTLIRYLESLCKRAANEIERLNDQPQTSPEPDAWEWRACIGGRWGAWLYLDQPLDRFMERNKFNLDNGTYELRPLHAGATLALSRPNQPSPTGEA
jgi:hypothetical protein